MTFVLSAKHFHDETAAYAFLEARSGRRAVLPALRRRGAQFQDGRQVHPHRRLQVLRLPQAFHREGRDRVRVQPCAAALWLQAVALLSARRRASAPISFTASLASRSSPRGSCRIASARRCGTASLLRWAALGNRGSRRDLFRPTKGRTVRALVDAFRPFTKGASRPATSAPLSRLSSVAVSPFLPCRERRQGDRVKDRRGEHRPREPPAYRRKPPLQRRGMFFAAHETVKHSAGEYVRGDVPHQFGRRLLFDPQARHDGRLSALRREAPSPLSGGFDFRYNNRIALAWTTSTAPTRRRHRRQAPHLSNDCLRVARWLQSPKLAGRRKLALTRKAENPQPERFIEAARELGVDETWQGIRASDWKDRFRSEPYRFASR